MTAKAQSSLQAVFFSIWRSKNQNTASLSPSCLARFASVPLRVRPGSEGEYASSIQDLREVGMGHRKAAGVLRKRFSARHRASLNQMPTMRRMKANFMPMLRPTVSLLLSLLVCVTGGVRAQSLATDQSQSIHVEADAMQYNDVKQISVFTGNVVVTKGSIVIRAAKVDVRQTPDGYSDAVAYGSPGKLATYEQTMDAQAGQPTPAIHGRAVTIDYDGKTDVVTFTGQAMLDRLLNGKLSDRAQGRVITYNNLTDVFAVVGGKGGVTTSNPDGRVRVMLSPRPAQTPAASSPAAPSQAAPALKLSPRLRSQP